jgi:hypothetical protein
VAYEFDTEIRATLLACVGVCEICQREGCNNCPRNDCPCKTSGRGAVSSVAGRWSLDWTP